MYFSAPPNALLRSVHVLIYIQRIKLHNYFEIFTYYASIAL